VPIWKKGDRFKLNGTDLEGRIARVYGEGTAEGVLYGGHHVWLLAGNSTATPLDREPCGPDSKACEGTGDAECQPE